MATRKKNFIDNIPKDKKSHIIFGAIVNPIIILLTFKIFGGLFLAFLLTVVFHLLIEFYQKTFNKGKFELWDAAAGISTAILYILTIIII